MPYVDQYYKTLVDFAIENIVRQIEDFVPENKRSGVANYVITQMTNKLYNSPESGYNEYNNAIGVLECAKLELYRRVVSPYEDKKKEGNGDVYE